jgi:hypothetical protein
MSPGNSLNASILLHQSGRLAEVWALHQQILVESPGYADSANHFFGMLKHLAGSAQETLRN